MSGTWNRQRHSPCNDSYGCSLRLSEASEPTLAMMKPSTSVRCALRVSVDARVVPIYNLVGSRDLPCSYERYEEFHCGYL